MRKVYFGVGLVGKVHRVMIIRALKVHRRGENFIVGGNGVEKFIEDSACIVLDN
jgi:hypothetical protein